MLENSKLQTSTLLYIAITIIAFIVLMLFIVYLTRNNNKTMKYAKEEEDDIDNLEIYNKLQNLTDEIKRLESKLTMN